MLSAPLDLSWPSMVGALNVSKVFSKLQYETVMGGTRLYIVQGGTRLYWAALDCTGQVIRIPKI